MTGPHHYADRFHGTACGPVDPARPSAAERCNCSVFMSYDMNITCSFYHIIWTPPYIDLVVDLICIACISLQLPFHEIEPHASLRTFSTPEFPPSQNAISKVTPHHTLCAGDLDDSTHVTDHATHVTDHATHGLNGFRSHVILGLSLLSALHSVSLVPIESIS